MRQKGFTLVELLVAIGIIGILSSIAVVSVSNVRAKARDAKRIGDIKQIQTALESYFNDQNQYPSSTTAVVLGGSTSAVMCNAGNGFDTTTTCPVDTTTIYLNPVPKSPMPNDGGGYSYVSNAGDMYAITFKLESGSGTLVAGTYEASPNGIVKK